MKCSKRMKLLNQEKVKLPKFNNLIEIIDQIKKNCTAKFCESLDIAISLGINSKKSDENVRGSFSFPFGVAKKKKIAAFVPPLLEDEARKAGADIIGLEDLVAEIKKTEKINFDVCFTTQEALPKILSIAKILGQNGVMPNKKDGTVTADIIKSIKEVKEGKQCLFRNDPAGYLHTSVGKSNMDSEKIAANILELISYVRTLKPPKVKEMIKVISISSTMGIGIKIPLRFID